MTWPSLRSGETELFDRVTRAENPVVFWMIVGTWILIRRRGQSLDYSDGARVGFLSSFYGSVAAIALHHLARRAEELEIWNIENLYLLPPLLADLGLEGESVGDWYLWMAQLVILTIVADGGFLLEELATPLDR